MQKKARIEVEVSANFDLSGLQEENTGDSDSDFDLDYTVVWDLNITVAMKEPTVQTSY